MARRSRLRRLPAEWIIVQSKALEEVRSGANLGLEYFAQRVGQIAEVDFVRYVGASWTARNLLQRVRLKAASVISTIGAGATLYRKCNPRKIVYQNAFSGYLAALRTIAFTIIALRAGSACAVLHVRNGNLIESSSWRLYRKYLSKHAQRVIIVVQFEGLAAHWRDAGFRALVLPNAIEAPKSSADMRRADCATFCYLGTRFESKGIIDFLEAAKRLTREVPFRILVAGPSVSSDVDARIAELMRGEEKFQDLGVIDHEKIDDVLGASHYIVLPTRYRAESMPRVLVEAISMGCVPIVTNHAGIVEQVGEVSMVCEATELEIQMRIAVREVENGDWQARSSAALSFFDEHFSPATLDRFVVGIQREFS